MQLFKIRILAYPCNWKYRTLFFQRTNILPIHCSFPNPTINLSKRTFCCQTVLSIIRKLFYIYKRALIISWTTRAFPVQYILGNHCRWQGFPPPPTRSLAETEKSYYLGILSLKFFFKNFKIWMLWNWDIGKSSNLL